MHPPGVWPGPVYPFKIQRIGTLPRLEMSFCMLGEEILWQEHSVSRVGQPRLYPRRSIGTNFLSRPLPITLLQRRPGQERH